MKLLLVFVFTLAWEMYSSDKRKHCLLEKKRNLIVF